MAMPRFLIAAITAIVLSPAAALAGADEGKPGLRGSQDETGGKTPASTGEDHGSEPHHDFADVPGEDIFGFTSPTGLGEAGNTGIASENSGASGKRGGRYGALSSKTEFSRTFREDLWAAVSVFGTGVFVRDVPDVDPVKRATFDGVSAEVSYRVLERSHQNPLAITLSFEPRWARIDPNTGERVEGFFSEAKMFVDAPIVPDRLFWALNFNYDPGVQKGSELDAKWQRVSTTNVSTALTYSWSEHFFTGVEFRSLAAYDGIFLNHKAGQALFVGPTTLIAFDEHTSLNFAWTPQVRGHSRAKPERALDLDNFSRHQFRLKLAHDF
jgi:hypothetical protein